MEFDSPALFRKEGAAAAAGVFVSPNSHQIPQNTRQTLSRTQFAAFATLFTKLNLTHK